MIGDFHFLRPAFLLLVPLVLLLGWWLSSHPMANRWARHVPADKLRALSLAPGRGGRQIFIALALAWVLACLALAGPSWEQRPVPGVRDQQPLVVLLDLSPSMLASDLRPDRLTRARFKLIDLLRIRTDGQTALIAYADDPHVVSPLTDDARTIEALLPALSPEIMPVPGSRTEDAFAMALELLSNAGMDRGHVLLVTDGVVPQAQRRMQSIRPAGVRLSILGIGTEEGAPIPALTGFVRDGRDQIVVASLNRSELQSLARSMGGRYADLAPDDSDIAFLLAGLEQQASPDGEENAINFDQWYDMGYWLALLLLPFALYAWRRGLVFALPLGLGLGLMLAPDSGQAQEWQDLWLRPDQRAFLALEQGNLAEAERQLNRTGHAGGLYLLGNTLAQQGRLEEALSAYQRALEQNPQHQNARYNHDRIREFLENQQADQQPSGEQDSQTGGNGESGDPEERGEIRESGESGSGRPYGDQDQQAGASQPSPEGDPSETADENAGADAGGKTGESAGSPLDGVNRDGDKGDEDSQPERQQGQRENGTDGQAESGPEDQAGTANGEGALSPASEQWLRAIPDDPAGLLRRKFQYQSDLYRQQQRFAPPRAPGSQEERRY